MDKPGYTPGPWIVTDERAMCRELWINVLHPDVGTVSLAAVRPGCDAANELGDTEANARLIAAAPEMFEALCDLSIFYGDDTEAREVLRSDFTGPEPLLMDDDALRESVWNNARAALSKATGGSHEQG